MGARRKIVVVGGGIQGLAVAFNLARWSTHEILVLDAGYFQGGASGRNGTLIRGGFSSPEWTRFFARSNTLWRELSNTLGQNVMFTRRGYIIVAENAATMERLRGMRALHADVGYPSVLKSPQEIRVLEPLIEAREIAGGLHLPEGGVAPHHAVMKGYLAACKARGVTVRYGIEVTDAQRRDEMVTALRANGEWIPCDIAVLAAGAYSVAVGAALGAPVPGFPMRIEAMALEPVRPILRSAIALPDSLCYLHQTARGEIVGGAEVPERPVVSLTSDLAAMTATARAYARIMPPLGHLRILRQWAGLLHATPDWGPLIGPHPSVRNLWVSAGWSYGFAGAPAAGELLAHAILSDRVDPLIEPFAVDRFEKGRPVLEASIVLAPVKPGHVQAAEPGAPAA
jgi:sarcosine oxidase subunit beta